MSDTISTRTICCKVVLESTAEAALRLTQAAFNRAATYCAGVAWEQGITNKNKLHHLVYGPMCMVYELGVQLACCATDKAADSVRAVRVALDRRDRQTNAIIPKTCPTFRDDGSVRYNARTYRLMRLDQVSL